jgi:hypothetical protein
MNRRRSRIVLVTLAAVVVAALLWYFYGPRYVPEGQPPLATLRADRLEALRADFNRDAGRTRIIVLLSPT